MSHASLLRAALQGVAATSATPFTSDLSRVDVQSLRQNTEFLVDQGVSMFYPAGNTGEFFSLSLQDWSDVVAAVVECASGATAMVPGVGRDLPTALEMRRRADDMGAAGVMIMPPEQPHISAEGLRRYLETVIDAGELPVVLYRRPHGPGDETVVELASHPKVVGVKYGVNDVHAFREAILRTGDQVVWTCGLAERYAAAFSVAGSSGFTSGLVNFAPTVCLDLAEHLAHGHIEEARTIQDHVAGFEALRARDGDANNVAAVKAAMDIYGLQGGNVRPPLRNLDGPSKTEVEQLTKDWTKRP